MILADALCYAEEFKPSTIIDVATLTGRLSFCYSILFCLLLQLPQLAQISLK